MFCCFSHLPCYQWTQTLAVTFFGVTAPTHFVRFWDTLAKPPSEYMSFVVQLLWVIMMSHGKTGSCSASNSIFTPCPHPRAAALNETSNPAKLGPQPREDLPAGDTPDGPLAEFEVASGMSRGFPLSTVHVLYTFAIVQTVTELLKNTNHLSLRMQHCMEYYKAWHKMFEIIQSVFWGAAYPNLRE